MADLIAQGPHRQQRWRRRLPQQQQIILGRDAGPWSASWDGMISRQHVALQLEPEGLVVKAVESARNPVFFQGKQRHKFRLRSGEHFVIGQTSFMMVEGAVSISQHAPAAVTEQMISLDSLREHRFHDPDRRIELLSRLPSRFADAALEDELHRQVIAVLLEGVTGADAAAMVELDGSIVEFLCWDWAAHRDPDETMHASQRLIIEALSRGESVVHTWGAEQNGPEFTERSDLAWAFCTPIPSLGGDQQGLYVMGSAADKDTPTDPCDLRDEMKFAEVVASTLSSFREVKRLQEQQSAFRQFFSPPVIAALNQGNAEDILAPREVDVTVLFCDLRGFSLESERSADDLFGLLNRVGDALGILTKHILHEGGVVGDFHGDSAMGFWGWPLPQADAASRAARAALAIRREFAVLSVQPTHALRNFRIGMGIASGRAVAGKIGTAHQVKVTAFGPAVNLASRLEGMTKFLHAAVLADAPTAIQIRQENHAELRLRRLAVVRPYGLKSALDVHEILPSETEFPVLSNQHLEWYEQAVDYFIQGDWHAAWEKLHLIPAADLAKDFLTMHIASRARKVPDDWDGVIQLDAK
jgi:adenylate cyclase